MWTRTFVLEPFISLNPEPTLNCFTNTSLTLSTGSLVTCFIRCRSRSHSSVRLVTPVILSLTGEHLRTAAHRMRVHYLAQKFGIPVTIDKLGYPEAHGSVHPPRPMLGARRTYLKAAFKRNVGMAPNCHTRHRVGTSGDEVYRCLRTVFFCGRVSSFNAVPCPHGSCTPVWYARRHAIIYRQVPSGVLPRDVAQRHYTVAVYDVFSSYLSSPCRVRSRSGCFRYGGPNPSSTRHC